MRRHFYELLKQYRRSDMTSFHTPGHKCKSAVLGKLLSLDFTELPETDSLYEASGIIKKAEETLTKLFGTERSFYSCGGNTLCIQAMLRLAAPHGGKILCDRIVHRSAVSAMALLGIEPIWIKRKFNPESRLFEELDIDDVREKLGKETDVRALYLTSPSYYGILQDIKSISKECKKHGIALLVDNAHGSHLMFVGNDLHPLTGGADLVADSAHKTLPVLTGGAWLHVNNEKFVNNAKDAMALFGSTSPSYPIMASMDICTDWLKNRGKEEFEKLQKRVLNIKKLACENGFYVLDKKCDPLRISLGVWNFGITGREFGDYLREFKIEPEFCDENYVVLIPTPFNDKKDWQRLKKAIGNVSKVYNRKENKESNFSVFEFPEKVKSLREALMSEKEVVKIENAKGKIAAGVVCPCPPGVPIVMPGEKIGEFETEALKRYGISELAVLK